MSLEATDLMLHWDPVAFVGDIALADDGDLGKGDLLGAAVLVSLLTWRRAADDDDVSDFTGDRQGWWGDSFASVDKDLIGSRLWLLIRSKLSNDVLNEIRQSAEEALAWIVEDKVASRVDIDVQRLDLDSVGLTITIVRTDSSKRVLRFDNIWGTLNA